jgi:hypothetical protein
MAKNIIPSGKLLELVLADEDSGSEPEYDSESDDFESSADTSDSDTGSISSELISSRAMLSSTTMQSSARATISDPSTSSHSQTKFGGGERYHGSRKSKKQKVSEVTVSDGWEVLDGEESYTPWITDSQEFTGPTDHVIQNCRSPLDFLFLFLTQNFWDLVVSETNRYARQFIENHSADSETPLKRTSRFRSWEPVTYAEMMAFFALYFAMGH